MVTNQTNRVNGCHFWATRQILLRRVGADVAVLVILRRRWKSSAPAVGVPIRVQPGEPPLHSQEGAYAPDPALPLPSVAATWLVYLGKASPNRFLRRDSSWTCPRIR